MILLSNWLRKQKQLEDSFQELPHTAPVPLLSVVSPVLWENGSCSCLRPVPPCSLDPFSSCQLKDVGQHFSLLLVPSPSPLYWVCPCSIRILSLEPAGHTHASALLHLWFLLPRMLPPPPNILMSHFLSSSVLCSNDTFGEALLGDSLFYFFLKHYSR